MPERRETTEDVIEQLNSYTGDNIWEDVIRLLPDYDDAATEQADPNYYSDVIVLTDEIQIVYDGQRDEWMPPTRLFREEP